METLKSYLSDIFTSDLHTNIEKIQISQHEATWADKFQKVTPPTVTIPFQPSLS